MHGFLNVIASLFPYDFAASVIQHPLLSNTVESVSVAVGLLLLRNCLPSSMFAHVILVIVFPEDLPVGSHHRRTHEALADVRAFDASAVHIFMDYDKALVTVRETEHVLEWVATQCHHHHAHDHGVLLQSPEAGHHLLDVLERVHHMRHLHLRRHDRVLGRTDWHKG